MLTFTNALHSDLVIKKKHLLSVSPEQIFSHSAGFLFQHKSRYRALGSAPGGEAFWWLSVLRSRYTPLTEESVLSDRDRLFLAVSVQKCVVYTSSLKKAWTKSKASWYMSYHGSVVFISCLLASPCKISPVKTRHTASLFELWPLFVSKETLYVIHV